MENKNYYIKSILKTLATAVISILVALLIANSVGGESKETLTATATETVMPTMGLLPV